MIFGLLDKKKNLISFQNKIYILNEKKSLHILSSILFFLTNLSTNSPSSAKRGRKTLGFFPLLVLSVGPGLVPLLSSYYSLLSKKALLKNLVFYHFFFYLKIKKNWFERVLQVEEWLKISVFLGLLLMLAHFKKKTFIICCSDCNRRRILSLKDRP